MNEKHQLDWHMKQDGSEFEVEELLDIDGEFDINPEKPRYLVEEWRYRLGFEEHRTFGDEDLALNYARKKALKTGGRFRVLRAPEGESFDRIE